ncbi:Pr6Pr family membrane protein [Sediminibacterium ginsengisoli]|uniref:FAR-17a/AIG1-like protein n=1 Tax=Sediminibacterium ginsengisoli TaxID=413434 RepID=A0A1T4P4R1_9BACT|nr:Pr6Pr family membrane protein [Sediminibacterium ginsengisoli]SJZ86590.1 hypothetical protein SAMN04488132_105155 [Sediminibacterium ginsengisoli]
MTARKKFLLLFSAVAWFALICQFMLQQQVTAIARAELLIRFFSFFTVLSNLLVAVCVTSLLMRPAGFFRRPGVQSAVTLYILIVGLVYNMVLRHLWSPEGMQAVVDDLLHSVIPLMMLFYWWRWTDTRSLRYNQVPFWLIYPACYTLFILLRGHYATWYPYPFINVTVLGYPEVMVNSFFIMLAFLAVAFVIVWYGKRKKYGPVNVAA